MITVQDKVININDEYDYDLIKKQMETMHPVTFGYKINVVLITDRLQGCAKGLKEYLENSTDISVNLVNSLNNAIKIIHAKPIDFLIVVGYLRLKRNYEAVTEFMHINKYSSAIIYAHSDGCINSERLKYGITFTYNRSEPVEGFVSFMRVLYEMENQRMYAESMYATREEVRRKALRDICRAEEEQGTNEKSNRIDMITILRRRFGLA